MPAFLLCWKSAPRGHSVFWLRGEETLWLGRVGGRRRISGDWLVVLLWVFSLVFPDSLYPWPLSSGRREGWWIEQFVFWKEWRSLLKPFSKMCHHSWLAGQERVIPGVAGWWFSASFLADCSTQWIIECDKKTGLSGWDTFLLPWAFVCLLNAM